MTATTTQDAAEKRLRIPPINLTEAEAKSLLSAKEGFGWPEGSEGHMTFESARRKVHTALRNARPAK